MNQPRSRLATLASTALAGLLNLPAAAQYATPTTPSVDGELPWYVGIGQGFFYDTNVGAGLPVIRTLQNLLQGGDRVLRLGLPRRSTEAAEVA